MSEWNDLDGLQATWDNAEASNPNAPIPDGIYQMKISRVELTRTKEKGLPMFRWELEVLGPTQAGRRVFINNVIRADTAAMSILKTQLHIAGVEPKKLSDLTKESVRKQLLDVVLEVKKTSKTKDGTTYENYFFNRKLDIQPGSEAAGDDDLPF
jgi:hypothetical protein